MRQWTGLALAQVMAYLNIWVSILYGISKATFEISQKIMPIHWKMRFLYTIENFQTLRFKSAPVIFNATMPYIIFQESE